MGIRVQGSGPYGLILWPYSMAVNLVNLANPVNPAYLGQLFGPYPDNTQVEKTILGLAKGTLSRVIS